MTSRCSLRVFALIATFVGITSAVPAGASGTDSDFRGRLEALMQEGRTPGLAVSVLVDGQVVRTESLGWADIDDQQPMRASSVLNIASVSKLVTSTAVLQLVETGAIELDADVSRYLPFSLRHPAGDEPITVRQLLTHTSGINDGPSYGASYACGDPAVSLEDWLRGYLLPDGTYYSTDNFLDSKPGTAFEYSNVGYGLLGLIAEQVSGVDFAELTRQRIFAPLGMTSTGWFLSSIDVDRHATPYWIPHEGAEPDPDELALLTKVPGDDGDPVPFCLYSFFNYPDGLVRTTIEDLARFVRATLPGAASPEPLLAETTREQIFRNQTADIESEGRFQGLGWRRIEVRDLGVLWGHGGADPGVRAQVLHRPADGVTILAMSNALVGEELRPILTLLFAEGAKAAESPRPSK